MPVTRRSFLAGAAGALVLPRAKHDTRRGGASAPSDPRSPDTGAQAAAVSTSSFDPWIEVVPAHLEHNAREVARAAGNRPILAVIKNNGYGLGVANVGQVLDRADTVHGFAVVKLHEAMALRDAGIRKPILLMGPFNDAELADVHTRGIMPMVYTPIGDALDRAAARAGRPVPIHVCVDTGLGRVGVPYDQAPALIRGLAGRKSVAIEGAMMTFTEDAAFDQEQLKRFLALSDTLSREGITLGRRHAASSYTFFQHDNAWLDMVRTGMLLYGVFPEPGFRKGARLDLKPAVALRTRVAYVKKLAAGASAGYNRAFVAARDTWVATLPVGHADGWPRVAAKGARVRINDRPFPIVASVSASHTIVDLGPEPAAQIGDVATLFDWVEGSRPEDVAQACGASVYDLLMHLGALVPRRVIDGAGV
jgi:alanine racemase